MNEPAWKKLAEELRARGIESPNAKQLESRFRAITGGGGLEAELISEMALSLRRAEDKILSTLLELEVLDKKIDEANATNRPADQSRLTALFNRRRDDVRGYVRDLAIQREAIGFRNNEALAKLYPIPPAKA